MYNLIGPNKEFRRFERKPYVKSFDYFVSLQDASNEKKLNLKARAIDISDLGIGIETDYPLAPGHELWINGGIDKAGVVRWCLKLDNNYRAGIKLKKEKENTSAYEYIEETASFVAEERGKYTRLLDIATEQFNRRMEDIEKRCSDPQENPDEIFRAVTEAIDDMMNTCAEFERGIKDTDIIRQARTAFRENTNPILAKSYFINRTRTWPQGSQGDYKTLESSYKNMPLSDGIGYHLDLFLLSSPLGIGVRNRIKILEGLLRDEIQKRSMPAVLNIACGSCRELIGVAPEIIDSKARVVCVDSDNDALAFAQSRLSYSGITEEARFYKYNALRLFDHEQSIAEFGKQDIIYSVGFFDYLPSDFLVKLFGSIYNMLNPGGKIIAAFKDARRYRSQEFHWLVDWDGFQQRHEEDFRNIMSDAGIPSHAMSETRDDSGAIIFYVITR